MENNKNLVKIVTILIILIIISIPVITIIENNNSNKEEPTITDPEITNTKKNNNKEIITKDQEIDGITFTDIKCLYDGENTNISYTITNTTKDDIEIGSYRIKIYNKIGEEIYSLSPYLPETLKSNEAKKQYLSTKYDLSDAYRIEMKLNK